MPISDTGMVSRVRTRNQAQLLASCLISCHRSFLCQQCFWFTFYPQASDVSEMHHDTFVSIDTVFRVMSLVEKENKMWCVILADSIIGRKVLTFMALSLHKNFIVVLWNFKPTIVFCLNLEMMRVCLNLESMRVKFFPEILLFAVCY